MLEFTYSTAVRVVHALFPPPPFNENLVSHNNSSWYYTVKKYFEVQDGIIRGSNMMTTHTDLLVDGALWFIENAERHDFLG